MRIETGALQIDNDWTGLFIRGDDALYLAGILSAREPDDSLEQDYIDNLLRIIYGNVDHKSKFRECVQIIRTT